MLKRLCALALAALLVSCLFAIGEGDVASLARAAGLEVAVDANAGGARFCDYTVVTSKSAAMSWSDADHVYSVSGDAAGVSQLYVNALALGGWDSCRYTVGKRVRISFGAESRQICDTPEDYLERMESELGVSAEAAVPTDAREYVLNTNTMRFHYPDCASVGQMKSKNRAYFTGTREEIIAMGYQPCGNCHP